MILEVKSKNEGYWRAVKVIYKANVCEKYKKPAEIFDSLAKLYNLNDVYLYDIRVNYVDFYFEYRSLLGEQKEIAEQEENSDVVKELEEALSWVSVTGNLARDVILGDCM